MSFHVFKVVNQTEIDDQIKSSESRKILIQVELFESDVWNPAMLESCKDHVLGPAVQTQNLGPKFGEERADMTMARAKLKYLLSLEVVQPIYFDKLVAALYPPSVVRSVKKTVPIYETSVKEMPIDRRKFGLLNFHTSSKQI